MSLTLLEVVIYIYNVLLGNLAKTIAIDMSVYIITILPFTGFTTGKGTWRTSTTFNSVQNLPELLESMVYRSCLLRPFISIFNAELSPTTTTSTIASSRKQISWIVKTTTKPTKSNPENNRNTDMCVFVYIYIYILRALMELLTIYP